MKSNTRIFILSLTLLTGVLMWLGWPPFRFSFLLFIGLVPVFLIEEVLEKRGSGRWFGSYTYLAMFWFNLLTTWWVGYASLGGAIGMLLANSLLMTIPFLAYRWTKKVVSRERALMAFVFYWMGFEYLHFNWDIAYPWLTLGNGLAASTPMIQWYQYTGVFGGSLWILLVNIMVYRLIMYPSRKKVYWLAGGILVPVLGSIIISIAYGEKAQSSIDLVVVQPNIDPYNKFNAGEEVQQVLKFLKLADSAMDKDVDLIVLPETAIVGGMDENAFASDRRIGLIRDFSRKHHGVTILSGAETYKFYEPGEKMQPTARKTSWGQYYEAYNTALVINSTGVDQVYHKSRLVPGAEKMPYPKVFKFLEKYALDLGGTSGSLGSSPQAISFDIPYDSTIGDGTSFTAHTQVAPLICYESVFGEYASEFVSDKLGMIFVITNDGWWENTAGYKQHMHYARLRAIESRKYVVRCANTGISCVIDPQGNILDHTEWWEPVAKRWTVPIMQGSPTVYDKTGDGLGKIAAFLAVMFLLSAMVKKVTDKLN